MTFADPGKPERTLTGFAAPAKAEPTLTGFAHPTKPSAASTASAPSAASAPPAETQRAVPYHCPFCAEEDLRPVASGSVPGLTRGGWHCRSCLRVFSLSFHGVHRPPLESDLS